VNGLNSSSHDLSTVGVLLREIRSNCIRDFDAARSCNKVAHSLAKFDLEIEDECVGWVDDPPQVESEMVASELAAHSG
jgi:hypothetical protein